jgi:hypothetical protein
MAMAPAKVQRSSDAIRMVVKGNIVIHETNTAGVNSLHFSNLAHFPHPFHEAIAVAEFPFA